MMLLTLAADCGRAPGNCQRQAIVGDPREDREGRGGGYSGARSGGAKVANNFDQRRPEHQEAPAPAAEITDEGNSVSGILTEAPSNFA